MKPRAISVRYRVLEGSMRLLPVFALLSVAGAVAPLPVSNAHTPGTLVNSLAVKRNWTLENSDFCRARAAANAAVAAPQKPTSKFKYIKTFSFRTQSTASNERTLLDFTSAGFQVPFPWQDGQWLSRQYSSDATPKYAYLLELQDRPKAQGQYSTLASACMTVFGLR